MIIRRLPFLVVVATTGFVLHNGGGQRRQTTATATATASTTTIAFVIPHSSTKRRRRHSHPRAATTTSTAATSVTHAAHEQQYDIPIIDNDIPIIDDDIPIIDIPIIYEDEYLLAINKPHNISHHDDPSTNQLGILSHIRLQQQKRQRQQQTSNEQQQQPTKLFPYPHRLYGVHRLDRVTSGILLLAKDSATANALMEKFAKREITKYYAAISARKATKKKQGWVKGVMGMGRRGSYRLLANSEKPLKEKKRKARETKGEDDGDDGGGDGGDNEGGNVGGKKKKKGGYAVTRFYTAGLGKLSLSPPLSSDDADGDDDADEGTVVPKTAIVFRPHTGKTHQLRVAAKSVSLPILGDVRYGGGRLRAAAALDRSTDALDDDDDDATTKRDESGDYDRTYLHASAMHFRMNDEREVTIYSPPPFDHLFSTDDEEALTNVFASLMEKHCDCIPILNVIREREGEV